jgi:hypothetical protein
MPAEPRATRGGIRDSRMRAVRLRLLALLATAAILLSSGASGHSGYLCHMTGHVVAACCCAVQDSVRPNRAQPSAEPADCCERLVSGARAGTMGTRAASPSLAGAALVAVLPSYEVALPAAESVAVVTRSSRAPPALGPPLFVVNCAFLI